MVIVFDITILLAQELGAGIFQSFFLRFDKLNHPHRHFQETFVDYASSFLSLLQFIVTPPAPNSTYVRKRLVNRSPSYTVSSISPC